MKKSLIAMAVLAASGAAMAQSSVTLYGVVDAGWAKANKDNPAGLKKGHMTGGEVMNNGTSRVGLRGVEDMGGGLKASFNIEGGFTPETGGIVGPTLWSRAAWVALGGPSWGELRLGRSLNPAFYATAAWELTGAANYSVVANTFDFAGVGPRTNSMFMYTTPNFGGFSAAISRANRSDGIVGGPEHQVNVIYANGPLAVAAAYNHVKDRVKKGGYNIGARYNFGAFSVATSYQDPADARKGFTLGGSFNTGPFTVTADVARNTGGTKYTNALLEGKYALSKRTFVYAAYLRTGLNKANNYGLGIRHNF